MFTGAPPTGAVKSTSGFITVLAAKRRGLDAVLAETLARRDHPGLAQHALFALGDLCVPETSPEVRESVVSAALETMRAHRNHTEIQFNGIRALAAANDGAFQSEAGEGAIGAIIAAMRVHARTRESGWRLLKALGEPQHVTAVASTDPEELGLEVCILRAMALHFVRLPVQQVGIDALGSAISDEDVVLSDASEPPLEERIRIATLVSQSGIPTVLKALQTHAAQMELQMGNSSPTRVICFLLPPPPSPSEC